MAVDLGRQLPASVTLVHVWEPPKYVNDASVRDPDGTQMPLYAYLRNQAQELLHDYCLTQRERLQTSLEERLVMGHAAREICRLAASEGFDLIVMGTHSRKGLSYMVLGSVATKVVRHAPCPVLTLGASPRPPPA
jgi:nucleotide-binding universal stress UspA family protein